MDRYPQTSDFEDMRHEQREWLEHYQKLIESLKLPVDLLEGTDPPGLQA